VISSRSQLEDEWIIHYKTIPYPPSSTFCQRLLGVRPTNLRTSETELTLSIMRLPVPRAGKGNRCQDSIQ